MLDITRIEPPGEPHQGVRETLRALAHDLRNETFAVAGSLGTLVSHWDKVADRRLEFVEGAHSSARRLQDLLDALDHCLCSSSEGERP